MERRVGAMEANLMGSIHTMQQTIQALATQVTDLTSGRLYLRFAGRNNEMTSIPTETSNSVEVAQYIQNNSTSNSSITMPRYRMSRGVKTIKDLWREWFTGLNGCSSINDLEILHGASWRNDDRQFYNRRKRIIDEIKKYAQLHSITVEAAVDYAEQKRIERSKTLDYLSKNPHHIF
jgi:hypothetical protein